MAASTRAKPTQRARSAERARARNRVKDARIALNQPAHVIASKSRARYIESKKVQRIPSIKPRLVPQPKKIADKTLIWSMRAFTVGIVASIVIVVGIQASIARRQIEIDAIRKSQKAEISKFEKIRHDIAELKSPERITRRAEHLGLVQPSKFVNVSIPMPVANRQDQQDDKLWREVKAIVDVTS